MPISKRHFSPGQLQFISSSVYRRMKLFDSHRLRAGFVEALRQLRQEMGFLLVGWVVMPEHFHLSAKMLFMARKNAGGSSIAPAETR